MGFALTVVMVSKQAVKVTAGLAAIVMTIVLLIAGFPIAHVTLEVSTQVTWSPSTGIYE
jgi:hypothetical protein